MSPSGDNVASENEKQRCQGCGIEFRPNLEGDLCPTCVEIVIANNLDLDDWEQHRLREEHSL